MSKLTPEEIERKVEEIAFRCKYEGYISSKRWYAKRRAKLIDANDPPNCAGRGRGEMSEYNVILADPPWHFRNYSADAPGMIHQRSRGAARYYPTMTTEDICKLSVPAEKDAVLFLWACWPMLDDALQVIKAWGFEYKTLAWVWVKANKTGIGFFHGMGYYTRSNSEPCFLATRGNVTKPVDRGIQALIYSAVQEHSRKPDDQYRKIEALYPSGRYLEMFARRKRDGWDSWGNTVPNDIEIQTPSLLGAAL